MGSAGQEAGARQGSAGGWAPPRVFISYAHDDGAHEQRVRDFWLFLRGNGIDASLDLLAAVERVDWAQWMTRQVRDADRVLVVASPEYKRRGEGDAGPSEGRGVQWEARLIRERFYADQDKGLQLVLPVVLPTGSADDLPLWLAPVSATHYEVSEFTVGGAEALLRVLTRQPLETVPVLGRVPLLPPRGTGQMGGPARPAMRSTVLIEARDGGSGQVDSVVWLGGTLLCQRQAPLPPEAETVWAALGLPPLEAAGRMAEAGRRLAGALLDERAQGVLAGIIGRLPPGDAVEVVLSTSGSLLSLPVELVRLASAGDELGPLGLRAGVSVYRHVASPGDSTAGAPEEPAAARGLPGPLKILAAVAAPDETRTRNVPLDVEAEMQAVLDAVGDVAGDPQAQVRILEVASLAQIRDALQRSAFHVLHLSAHGSADSVELEDEDGGPVHVTADALMEALRQAGREVPLIVLSSCSGGSGAAQAMAAGLIGRGADRVIAMLAPVTDGYATQLARRLYQQLASRPDLTVGQALATARILTEEDRSHEAGDALPLPEYGVTALLAAAGDGPLVNPAAEPAPLMVATVPVASVSVRELPLGALIGRRPQLRTAMGVLRSTRDGVRRFGAASGVVLTGIGGIGKTALAGRIIARLREDGWLVVVHEGRWNPIALITATATAVAKALPHITDPGQATLLSQAQQLLTAPGVDDAPKIAMVAQLLTDCRLLLVLDDFEQNLTSGGRDFIDPAVSQVLGMLTDAAQAGKVLITCRYPLPGPDMFVAQVPIPPLTPAELRRMFLRMPALAELDPADQQLLTRAIGGHPRLIEFTDALLRGGRSDLRHVQSKLRDLAADQGIDLRRERQVTAAVNQAMILGSADILLTELLSLLTPRQTEILAQVAVCRAAMTTDDLAFALTAGLPEPHPDHQDGLQDDVDRLTDLTLLAPGPDVVIQPWTATLVTRHSSEDPTSLHERALAMRLRRFEQDRGSYEDLLDIPRHLAALHRWDDIASIAGQAASSLAGTLTTLAYLIEVRPLIPATERAWMLVGYDEVQALLSAGALSAAIDRLDVIHQQVKKWAVADPGSTQYLRDLEVSHNRLADAVIAAGDLAAARDHYQAGLDIAERLAADSANSLWQHDLSVSHNKLGEVAAEAGDLAAARGHYQASLDILSRLAAADPADTQWQRDLSVGHNKLGDMAVAAGDLAAARDHYQAGLDIRERLAAADPANTQWQRDLSIGHDNLGDITAEVGDLATARDHYQASLDIRERLAAADPANTQWQRDLSVSHERLGDAAAAAGDLATARTHYQADLDIAERLAAADPINTAWQRDLSISHNKLGDAAAEAGDLAAARDHYQAGLDIAERLAAADPANTQWQRDLSVSHERLGEVAAAAGDLAVARAHYQADLDIADRLAAADPANTTWKRDLSVSHGRLGDVVAEAGDLAAARDHYQAGLDITERLAAADPANTTWQRDLSVTHERLGDVVAEAGDLAVARDHYQASLDITERLAAADPANSGWQRDLSISHNKVGEVAAAAGDLVTARDHYQASLDIRERLAAADPSNAEWQRDLSIVHEKIAELDGGSEEP